MKPVDAFITFCYTPDLTASARFYEEGLGLSLAVDQGRCRIYRVAGSGYLGLCEKSGAEATQGVLLTFVTDDVDAWFARAVDAGATVDRAPAHNPEFGIYQCFVRDPVGYVVEIQRFDDPGWSG